MIIHLGLKWKLVINKKLMTEEHFHERRNFLSRKHKKMNWNQRWSTNLLETCNFVRYCKCVLIGVLGGGISMEIYFTEKGRQNISIFISLLTKFPRAYKKLSANVLLQNTVLALTIINGFCRKEVGFLGMLLTLLLNVLYCSVIVFSCTYILWILWYKTTRFWCVAFSGVYLLRFWIHN